MGVRLVDTIKEWSKARGVDYVWLIMGGIRFASAGVMGLWAKHRARAFGIYC